jgi:signal transduction histidine kinase
MLRRRSIRVRILVLVLAPVVALVGLYAVVLDVTLGQYLTLRHASSARKAITQPVLKLQHELVAERGLALEYLVNHDRSRTLPLLLAQEGRTDTAAHEFGAAAAGVLASGVDSKERATIKALQSDLAGLGPLRTAVLGLGISLPAAASAYSGKVADGSNILIQAIFPLVTNTAGLQVASVATLNSSLQDTSEESDVVEAELMAHVFPAADQQLISRLATTRHEMWVDAMPGLDRGYQDYFSRLIPTGSTQALQAMERTVTAPAAGPRAVSPAAWTAAEGAYTTGFGKAVLASENGLVAAANQDARTIFTRLLLAAGLGLLAIAFAIGVAVVVSRRLIRELDDLRLSALSLASEGLPDAIERLRAGEVIETEAQTLLDSSPDEIGQVRLAFNTAAKTAIAAAVEEIKIRRSVNDVFRNLARRNQSLLTRQLELLDAMERRVHDPEELADLFRIDHMTTRMRRHAEGLLIVAGSSSGRTWREPVPLIDVMRAAIAEVESYTRVRVSSRTSAALAGHAVADLIHLLAELVENATMFSPANTPVRIDGDKVARGLALEIEDRGLGMAEAKLAEMNAKLVDPPMFDLSVSDQLGLFIAGQLARRHDIKITLRSSPYGGITAVVLIPNSLVADVDSDDELGSVSIRELGGRPVPQLPGPASTQVRENAIGANSAQGAIQATITALRPRGADDEGAAQGQIVAEGPVLGEVLVSAETPVDAEIPVDAESPVDAQSAVTTEDQVAAQSPYPVPGQFSTWSATQAGLTTPGADVTQPSPAQSHEAGLQGRTWPQTPLVPELPAWSQPPTIPQLPAWPRPPASRTADDTATGDTATDADLPVRQSGMTIAGWPSNGKSTDATPNDVAHELDLAPRDVDDLPVRVRQANLAPQLRASNPDRSQEHKDSSPEAARNIMAAMQRGWERGRAAPDQEADPGQDGESDPRNVRPTGEHQTGEGEQQ